MKPPITIRVTPYLTPLPRAGQSGPPRMRHRWRAELIDHAAPDVEFASEGHTCPDEAIGAVVLEAVRCLDGGDGGFELIAALFSNPAVYSARVSLGRAIRIAARLPKRQNPGCAVEIGDPADALGRTPAPKAKAASKSPPVTPSTLTPAEFAKCNAVLATIGAKRKGGVA